MLGIGFFEIVVIALVCFIAIGPKQLPAVMRNLAAFYRQFTSLRDELRFQILSADGEPEPKENKLALADKRDEQKITEIPKDQPHG